MTITTRLVTGPVVLPDGTIPQNGRVTYQLSGWDREGDEAVVIGPVTVMLDASGVFDDHLWCTDTGENGRIYLGVVAWHDGTARRELPIMFDVQSGVGAQQFVPSWVVGDLPESTQADALAQCLAAAASASGSAAAVGSAAAAALSDANRADAAATRAETYSVWPNPTYFLHAGQSNSIGANGSTSAYWPGSEYAGLAYVWVPSLAAWRDVTTRRGLEPFNSDGSNNSGAWAAVDLAKRRGVTVRMITSYSSGTQIYEWTGGGYNAGSPITTNRTISAYNRILCYNLQAQITAAAIPRIHAIGWQQGEADFATPDVAYITELDFLRGYFSGLGSAPVASARVPFVVSALYSGVNVSGSDRRNQCIADYCRANSQFASLIATDDLTADAMGNPDGNYKHFDDLSTKTIGLRMSAAVEAVGYGRAAAFDPALEALRIGIGGVYPSRLGHRTYETALSAGSYNLNLRGATQTLRGETYQIAGAVTLNLDPTAAANLLDGGAGCEFYIANTANSVTIKSSDGAGTTHDIWLAGGAAPVVGSTGITISGQRGRGRIVYEFNRWVVYWSALQPRITPGRRMLSGDNGYTISVTDGQYIDLAATLTAARSVSLSATGAVVGDVMSFRRSGGGAYAWTIRDATTTTSSVTISAAPGWADMLFDGTKWVPIRAGTV